MPIFGSTSIWWAFGNPQFANAWLAYLQERLAASMRTIEIFVVEDNPADIYWLKYILREAGVPHHLTIASDGEQAVDCLMRKGCYQHAVKPDLIFLDIHLPKFDGLEVLRRVPESAKLPICILSSSELEKDAVSAHFQNRACYLKKPLSSEGLRSALSARHIS